MSGPGGDKSAQTFSSSMTDLMTSLAVIFILLLVVFLKHAHDQAELAKRSVQTELEELLKEKSLAVRQDPEDPLTLKVAVGEEKLKFALGSSQLNSGGRTFVDGFFRNFAEKICSEALRDKVDSVIIEGHTDKSGERTLEGVKRNIVLSQKRSYAVLERALSSVEGEEELHECLLQLASATGKGSRSPVFDTEKVTEQKETATVENTHLVYNPGRSRRVEIKIRVRSAEQQFRSLVN